MPKLRKRLRKRYQCLSSNHGVPLIDWTPWFFVSDNCTREPYQSKCKGGIKLLNQYDEVWTNEKGEITDENGNILKTDNKGNIIT